MGVIKIVVYLTRAGSRVIAVTTIRRAASSDPGASVRLRMAGEKCVVLFFTFLCWATATESPCVIELECAECIPDHMPVVTSLRASNGSLVALSGDEVSLSCGAGRFLTYPLLATLTARCEAGRYRVPNDAKLRHLLELGCQENIFEDVLHTVEHCAPPLQGRAYQLLEAHNTRHVATMCYDEDGGLATFAHVTNAPGNVLRMQPHSEQRTPLTLFGNFNQMFDTTRRSVAEKMYSDDIRMNRRLHELFKHEKFSFAEQTITGSQLLSSHYFDDQNMRVADFVSNKIAAWKSVANGNLYHMHRDIAKFIKMTRPHATVDVYSGTHGHMALRTGHSKKDVYLKASWFPIPKYIWAVVHDKKNERAVAIVVLNDPFVAVSEIKDSVFCESSCSKVTWVHELRRNRNYESPIYGLSFCCSVHNFTNTVSEMPKAILANVHEGHEGLLTELNS